MTGIFLIFSVTPSARSDDILNPIFLNQRNFSSTLTLDQAQTNQDLRTGNEIDPLSTNADQTMFDPHAPPSEMDHLDTETNPLFGTTRQEADLHIRSAVDTASNTSQPSLYFPETELNVTAALDEDPAFLFPLTDGTLSLMNDPANTVTDTLYFEELSLSQNRRGSDLYVESFKLPYFESTDIISFDYSHWSIGYWMDVTGLIRKIQVLADAAPPAEGETCGDDCSTAEELVRLPGISEFYPTQQQIQSFSTSQEFSRDDWKQFLSHLSQKYYDFGASIIIPGPHISDNPYNYINSDRVLDIIENGTAGEKSYIRTFELVLNAGNHISAFNMHKDQYWVNSSNEVTRSFRINLRDDTGKITEFFKSAPPQEVGKFVRETFENDPQPGDEMTPSASDVILLMIKPVLYFNNLNHDQFKSKTIFVATSTEVDDSPAIKILFGVDGAYNSNYKEANSSENNQIYISPDLADYGYDLLFKPFEWDEFYEDPFWDSSRLYTSSLIRLALDGTLRLSESDPVRAEIVEGWLQTFENKEDLQSKFVRRFEWDLWNKYKAISIVTGDHEDQEDRVVAALDLGDPEEAAFRNYRILLNKESKETKEPRLKDYFILKPEELRAINRWLSDYPTSLIYRMGSFSKGIYGNAAKKLGIEYDLITPSYLNVTFASEDGTVNRLLFDRAIGFAVTTLNFNPFHANDTMNDVKNIAFNADVRNIAFNANVQPTTPDSSSLDLNLYNETYGRRPYLFNQHPLRIELFDQVKREELTAADPVNDSSEFGKMGEQNPYYSIENEWIWGVMRNTDLRLTELLAATQSNVVEYQFFQNIGFTDLWQPIYDGDPDKFASFRTLLSLLLPMAAGYSVFEPENNGDPIPDDMIQKDSPIFWDNVTLVNNLYPSRDSQDCTNMTGTTADIYCHRLRLPIYHETVADRSTTFLWEESNPPVGYLPIEVTCKNRTYNLNGSYGFNPAECNITRIELNLIPAEGSPDVELQFHESWQSQNPTAVNITYEFTLLNSTEYVNRLYAIPTDRLTTSGLCRESGGSASSPACYSPIDHITFEYSDGSEETHYQNPISDNDWIYYYYPQRQQVLHIPESGGLVEGRNYWRYNQWNYWGNSFNNDPPLG